jgi:hypothetical protein
MMNQRQRLIKLASVLCTFLLLSVAAQKAAYAAPSFSDFSFGSGTPFGGNTVLAGVGVTLSSTGTAPFESTAFLNTGDSAQVEFTFSEPITEFHLDVFAVRDDEFLTDFSIGDPTSLSGDLVNQGGLITTSLPFPDDSGSGRLSWVGINTTSITFTIGSSEGSALGVGQFGLMPAGAPFPGVCQIVLCNGLDYTGDCLVLGSGIHDFPALDAIGNDQAQSILVGPGTVAELWNGFTPYNGGFPNFEHETFTADDPDLNDNVIAGLVSSAAVFCDGDGDGVSDVADNCPLVANPNQANFDLDSFGDACDSDIDGDGKSNAHDHCDFTPAGQPVSHLTGCSIPELCPCAGPAGMHRPWLIHSEYVACVTLSATTFWLEGAITPSQKAQIITSATHSSCGC